jgi:membrane dipeptidase
MEGADPIRTPDEAEMWYERGLRIIGLAWDDTRYAAGAWRSGGGLTDEGRRLLEIMADMGFILDLSHMAEDATLQALDSFEGPIMATHSNSRALVPGSYQLSDVQIRLIAERDGVIGIALGNGFLKAGYRRGDLKDSVTLTHIVAHVDHICQIIGDATHVGFGSEFDGGYGVEDAPSGVESHSDFSLIGKALGEYGYTDLDIANIMGGNWLTLLRRALSS